MHGPLTCGNCKVMAVNLGGPVGALDKCQRINVRQCFGPCSAPEILWFQYGSAPATNWEGKFYCYNCVGQTSIEKARNKTKNQNWGPPCQFCISLGACWKLDSGHWLPGWDMNEVSGVVGNQFSPVPTLAFANAPHPASSSAGNTPSMTVQPIPSAAISTCPAQFACNWGASACSSRTTLVQQHDGNIAEVDTLRREVSILNMRLETEKSLRTSADSRMDVVVKEIVGKLDTLQQTVDVLHKNIDHVNGMMLNLERNVDRSSVNARPRSRSCYAVFSPRPVP